ncbi:hypothetical protein [Sphingorhabdus sp.]|uniref:hypothetical protein n=2 Tax=Sphingorhabdus sp. TaxID=1902408 RepID=UPI003BAF5D4C|nr:hypothetical protein [Sphingomonadales bacterium]
MRKRTFAFLIFIMGLASSVAAGPVLIQGTPGIASIAHLIFGDGWYQARVEQRVIIRFPRQQASPASARKGATASAATLFHEEKIGKCLRMDRLIASRPGPKQSLELVTREGQLIRAYLGDGCLAREFYAGAYVERSSDGKLCVDRDLLHARTGAQCEIDKFRLLVPD